MSAHWKFRFDYHGGTDQDINELIKSVSGGWDMIRLDTCDLCGAQEPIRNRHTGEKYIVFDGHFYCNTCAK